MKNLKQLIAMVTSLTLPQNQRPYSREKMLKSRLTDCTKLTMLKPMLHGPDRISIFPVTAK